MTDQLQKLIGRRSRDIQGIREGQRRTAQIQIAADRNLRVIRPGRRPAAVDRELNRAAGDQVPCDRHWPGRERAQIRHVSGDRT